MRAECAPYPLTACVRGRHADATRRVEEGVRAIADAEAATATARAEAERATRSLKQAEAQESGSASAHDRALAELAPIAARLGVLGAAAPPPVPHTAPDALPVRQIARVAPGRR